MKAGSTLSALRRHQLSAPDRAAAIDSSIFIAQANVGPKTYSRKQNNAAGTTSSIHQVCPTEPCFGGISPAEIPTGPDKPVQ
jgi:hypothetical protein